jgi:hypothetical protein
MARAGQPPVVRARPNAGRENCVTTLSPRHRIVLASAALVLITIVCGMLLAAAALVPAPPAVLPFVILACLGCPMSATFEVAHAVAVVREPRTQLRRELDRLPETPHPLGY